MTSLMRLCAALCTLASAVPVLAATAEAPPGVRKEVLVFRVAVGPDGRVTSAKPYDPAAPLVDIGQGFASRLVFTPARKDGKPVPSTTCATVEIAAEPKPDKTYGVRLLRAVNAPCVLEVWSALAPKVNRGENGGLIVLGADLLPNGKVDPKSITLESAELRVPQAGTQARYEDHARLTLRGSRFELDTVDGVPVTVHVSAPFQYGGGPGKRDKQEGRGKAAPPQTGRLPSWNARSTVPGVEVAKIDYTAPETAPSNPAPTSP